MAKKNKVDNQIKQDTKPAKIVERTARKGAGPLLVLVCLASLAFLVVFALLGTMQMLNLDKLLRTSDEAYKTDILKLLMPGELPGGISAHSAESTAIWLYFGLAILFGMVFFISIALAKVAKNSVIQVENSIAILKAIKKPRSKKDGRTNSLDDQLGSYITNDVPQNPNSLEDYKILYRDKLVCGECGSPITPALGNRGGILLCCPKALNRNCETPTIKNEFLQASFIKWYNQSNNSNLVTFSGDAFARSVKSCIIGKTIVFVGNNNVATANPTEDNKARDNFDF